MPAKEETEMRKAPLALAQGMKRKSSSVVPDKLKSSKMLLLEGVEGGEEVGADAEGNEGLGDLVSDEAGLANA
ncbi:Hypothetical predicted protein [Prunus dulcis]|nr:Hypothetical predicted protein [Prunus dulcis]